MSSFSCPEDGSIFSQAHKLSMDVRRFELRLMSDHEKEKKKKKQASPEYQKELFFPSSKRARKKGHTEAKAKSQAKQCHHARLEYKMIGDLCDQNDDMIAGLLLTSCIHLIPCNIRKGSLSSTLLEFFEERNLSGKPPMKV